MPSHLGDEFPRVTNAIEVIDEDVQVIFLGIKWLLAQIKHRFHAPTCRINV
jgi:hypothetical protein